MQLIMRINLNRENATGDGTPANEAEEIFFFVVKREEEVEWFDKNEIEAVL